MNRRYAALLLLPCLILLFMTAKARSRNRSPKSSTPATSGQAADQPPFLASLTAEQSKWVDTTLRQMSVEEKVGQVLFTTYHGSFTASDSETHAGMMHDIKDLHVGGFITITHASPLGIVKDQAYPTAVLANQLQAQSKLPLLIGADYERGTAMRQDEGTSFPTAMAVAAAQNPKDAYTMGKITALEARAVGVHWVYAPVCDVNNNPGNPIINTRSFGEDPVRVSEFVEEFIRGVQENGAMATAKHFPGHGDTATDSHIDLPVIKADRGRMEHLELVPFRAAIAAGVGSIMTGHLNVPSYEPDPNTPATLSSNILTGLLRDRLKFQGLVVTDALDMGGITVRYAPGEAAVRAFLAGADALLMPPVPEAAYQAMLAAAK
ncbi:MAG TPA: glycoside hydrolase family 3 N-terminal domain-containing protein, partial [Candidatus Limnocylindrales bacterium]|nr:glycoside hydrolase family 3 N-terminal domain-containing protein [Candidatus Limnocylindrales bacterium]